MAYKDKTTKKKKPPQRGFYALTKMDMKRIRQFLPINYRVKMAETLTGIDKRQITHVMAQRSRNHQQNVAVWGNINELLKIHKQYELAKKVQGIISYHQNCIMLYEKEAAC